MKTMILMTLDEFKEIQELAYVGQNVSATDGRALIGYLRMIENCLNKLDKDEPAEYDD